jgi:TRAP-type C4-dicarboxylate transport system permease small subunit
MNKLLIQLEEKVASILMIFIVALVFISAMMRWIGHPISWSVDMAQLCFVWACFLGADRALRAERHIGVDIIVRTFPEKVQKIIVLSSYILIITFLAFVLIYGVLLSTENYLRQFNGMPISFAWATMSAPIGSVLMIITLVGKVIRLIKGEPTLSSSVETVQQL